MPFVRSIRKPSALIGALAAGILVAIGAGAAAGSEHAASSAAGFHSRVLANGAHLRHKTAKGSEALSAPDDITELGGHIFVGFQNGVGPQGEASTTGNTDSTVVEFDRSGHAVAQWDVVGKCDGLTADPALGRVIATVNEDAHSSFYLIDPVAGVAPAHYHYNKSLPSHGGTDAITVYHGMLLFSASAPGTTGKAAPQPGYPAVYRVVLNSATHVGAISGLFSDEATATTANAGAHNKRVKLALTDPDSNETVPSFASRFAGDFMLTSQGDKEQIFVSGAGTRAQRLSVLKLSDSVDDTAWAADATGTLYASDNGADTIDAVTGPFHRGEVLVADTPCDANGSPSTCPGPGFPANFLGRLNPSTGAIRRVSLHGPALAPGGMLFLP